MPPIETLDLHQTAVLWAQSDVGYGVDEDGEPIVEQPAEISCRWEWGRRETVNSKGDPMALDATVIVSQEVEVGSAMVLGTIVNLTGAETKMYVVTSANIPDIKNRNNRRVLGLNRLGDTVPTLES